MRDRILAGVPFCMLRRAAVLVCMFAAFAAAQQYPRIEITPARPTTVDTVIVRLVMGVSPTTCVPQYANRCTVTVDETPAYPPHRVILMNVDATPPPRRIECVADSTEYGPVCTLGGLPAALYIVKAGDLDTAGSFRVVPPGLGFRVGGAARRDSASPPMSGVVVRLERQDTAAGPDEFVRLDSAVCSPFYEFTLSAAGVYRLTVGATYDSVWHRFYLPDTVVCTLATDTAIDFLVSQSRGVGFTGTVYDIDRHALAACSVTVRLAGQDTVPWPGPYRTHSDTNGAYRISDIPTGMVGVAASIIFSMSGCEPHLELVKVYGGEVIVNATVACPGVDFPVHASVTDNAVRVDIGVHITPAPTDTGPRSIRFRCVLHNTGGQAVSYDLAGICRYTDAFDPRGLGISPVSFELQDSSGAAVQWLVSQSPYYCDASTYRLTLPAQDSAVYYTPPLIVQSSTDSVTVRAWVRGHEPTTSTYLGFRLPPVGTREPGSRRATSRQCRFAQDGVVLDLAHPSAVTVDVWDLRGRLLAVLLQARVFAAGRYCLRVGAEGASSRPCVVRVKVNQTAWARLLSPISGTR